MSVISTALRSGPPRLQAQVPVVHLLGNGSYSVWLTEAGMGRSTWRGSALSRWAGERIEDADGWRFWLRDHALGRSWTLLRPTSSRPLGQGHVAAGSGVIAWSQRDHGIESRFEVCVAPEHDAELRTLTVRNHTERRRTIELTGCLELVLHDPDADASHPAFSKLFVQTEWDAEARALIASRRPRSPGESHPVVAHSLLGEGAYEYETDRARFLGRGRSWSRPAGLANRQPLSGSTGSVLDPVFATRRVVELGPGEERRWTFVLAAAADRDGALQTLRAYASEAVVDAAFSAAQSAARRSLDRAGLTSQDAEWASQLAGALLYGDPRLRTSEDVLRAAGDDAPVRARLGIPCRSPLVVVRLDEPGASAEWAGLHRALRLWRAHGIDATLVAVGGVPAGGEGEPGVVLARPLELPERMAIEAGARIVVREGTRAVLRQPVDEPEPSNHARPAPRLEGVARARGPRRAREALRFDNGFGGFSGDGREYVVRLDPRRPGGHRMPPAPWVNVIANERFGTLVSESGAGFTWSGNSREHRLTPWSNDALLDPHGEALYLQELSSGAAWSPLPGPRPHPAGYEVRHGLGYSTFRLEAESLVHETCVSVDREAPVKLVRLKLRNLGETTRSLAVYTCARLVLGPDDGIARRVVTAHDPRTGALLARNAAAGAWADAVAFSRVVTTEGATVSATTDRLSFVGRHGGTSGPHALRSPAAFDGVTGPMHDPCFAWRVSFELEPGGVRDLTFVMGEGADAAETSALLARFSGLAAADASLASARGAWHDRVSRVHIETPAPELDLMVNAWLPYQTLSCRIWGRSAFYQSGGAFGYRDQLQDALSMLALEPELAREQLLLNAAHQFVEGDVLHWWHPPLSRGLRTRFVDDLLWLPYLAATYVKATGDNTLLDQTASFVSARPLAAGEDEAYLQPERSLERATLYEHAARAIERSLDVGAHGLPLFGSGDWNDGMNRVGREGRGESVWMGWFLCAILGDWADLAEGRDDLVRAQRWRAHREGLQAALETEAWDGEWYRRGWYDNGEPLGSRHSDECQIDALAQAWSVLSGAAPRDRAARAMASVESRLVSEPDRLIRLLAPPFRDTAQDPGYIKGYVAGVRENGGQYTHAALWVVRALAELGRRDRAARLLAMLSPVSHGADAPSARRYQVEPYVVAADVCGVAPHVGRGGWTWYTGSSGWMYRVALESVLGVRLETGNKLVVKPCIPDDWPGYTMTWTLPGGEGTRVEISVRNPDGSSETVHDATYDGRPARVSHGEARVPLLLDGEAHRLEITLGRAT